MTDEAPPPPPQPAAPEPPAPQAPQPTGGFDQVAPEREPDVRKDNPIALASMVVGLAALLLSIIVIGGLVAIIAIVMAGIGLKRAKTTNTGKALAWSGISLSIMAIGASFLSGILIIEAVENGTLSLEGFNPDPSSADFPVDDDLVEVDCTEDGLALAIITVENNTDTNQRYIVTITWDAELADDEAGDQLRGDARSDIVEPGETEEIRIFERSSSAIIDSCELESFSRTSTLLN